MLKRVVRDLRTETMRREETETEKLKSIRDHYLQRLEVCMTYDITSVTSRDLENNCYGCCKSAPIRIQVRNHIDCIEKRQSMCQNYILSDLGLIVIKFKR